jgi:molybdate transport system regulatory protein
LLTPEGAALTDIRFFIRLDLPNGDRIGPGKIALLKAIRVEGSITGAARYLGMSYRRAWLLVQEINNALQQPAVTTTQGGANGSGAAVTPVGENVIELYHSIEGITRASAHQEFQAIAALVRREATTHASQQRMMARQLKRLEIAHQLNSESKRKSARMLKVTKAPEPSI